MLNFRIKLPWMLDSGGAWEGMEWCTLKNHILKEQQQEDSVILRLHTMGPIDKNVSYVKLKAPYKVQKTLPDYKPYTCTESILA